MLVGQRKIITAVMVWLVVRFRGFFSVLASLDHLPADWRLQLADCSRQSAVVDGLSFLDREWQIESEMEKPTAAQRQRNNKAILLISGERQTLAAVLGLLNAHQSTNSPVRQLSLSLGRLFPIAHYLLVSSIVQQ